VFGKIDGDLPTMHMWYLQGFDPLNGVINLNNFSSAAIGLL
jgi:hypothetical protein